MNSRIRIPFYIFFLNLIMYKQRVIVFDMFGKLLHWKNAQDIFSVETRISTSEAHILSSFLGSFKCFKLKFGEDVAR